MNRQPQVLICDDDSLFHSAVKHSLKGKFGCRTAYNSDEAQVILRNHPVDIVLLDIQMRTPDEGLRAIPRLLETDPDVVIIMSSGLTDFRTVREAMLLGASDYIPKNFDPDELMIALNSALERKNLKSRSEQQNFEARRSQSQHVLIGESAAIVALRKAIERIRMSPANVVITGETGTGKEVVARQLRGSRPDGSLAPFVAIDSATIQSSTAESQLFGHEKGAFTGADRAVKGVFEEADGGIVYFDEIANMPLEIQAKLLRVIQEREVVRLGSTRTFPLDFRVVCATNRDLEKMAAAGQFKDDLLQRLNVLPIELPPLRARAEDIPLLVRHFVQRQGTSLAFTDDAIAALQSYSWPGNIRELSNVIAYVATMTEGTEVDVSDLPPRVRDGRARATASPGTGASRSGDDGTFYDRIAAYESSLLREEYARHGGNVSRMAMALGMDRSHLYTKLREFKIK